MRKKNSNRLMSGIALALLLGFLWIYSDTGTPPTISSDNKKLKEPEFFIHNVYNLSFNEQGMLTQTLTAKKLQHFSTGKRKKNQYTELKEPVINLYKDNHHKWQISSKTGTVKNEGKQIDLKNSVIISSSDQLYKLTTSALRIYPAKNIAENNKAVTITSPQGVTTSIGIRTDLNTEHTILKKNVQGTYHVTP